MRDASYLESPRTADARDGNGLASGPPVVADPRPATTAQDVASRPSARFGPVIRELRESRGWSQEHLAGQASLNRSYMGEIERSVAMPSLATAEKLASALDVALSELISRCERTART